MWIWGKIPTQTNVVGVCKCMMWQGNIVKVKTELIKSIDSKIPYKEFTNRTYKHILLGIPPWTYLK